MKFWTWLRTAATRLTEQGRHAWLFLLLTAAPLAAAMSEPRTFPFDGYRGLSYAPAAIAVAVFVALFCQVPSGDPPLPARFHHVAALLALVGLAFGGFGILWIVPIAIFALSALLRRVEKTTLSISPRLAFAALAGGMIALGDVVHEYLLTQVDLRQLTSTLLHGTFGGLLRDSRSPSLSASVDGRPLVFQIALDRLGGVYLVTLALLVILISVWCRRSSRRLLGDLAVLAVYAPIAGVFLLLRNAGLPEWNWFADWEWPLLYAPYAIWASCRILDSKAIVKRPPPTWAWGTVLAGSLFFASGLSIWGPSTLKPGRIVMDEAHGDWETARVPLKPDVFGTYTTYNYRTFYQELNRIYGAELATKELTAEELRGVSVLILKTPTVPYSQAFQEALVDYVRNGGGLWLVGDHTDAFGMSTYLNPVASRFGIEFKKNAWFEPPVKRNLWSPDAFTDPVARGLATFLFYTGCELRTPPLDKKLMVARRNVWEEADYSAGSFFGPLRMTPNNDGGNVTMASLGQRGEGRVAVWSDSTLYSNFSIYTPGKLQIALNTIEWLRHKNDLPIFRPALLVVGLLLVAAGLWQASGIVLLSSALVAASWVPLLQSVNQRGSRLWSPKDCLSGQLISFYDPLKSPHLPVYVSLDKAETYGYLTSFMAGQRIGKRPFVAESLADAKAARSIVVIPFNIPIPADATAELSQWVKDGGRLVILDGGNDGGVFVNKLFGSAGIPAPFKAGDGLRPDAVDLEDLGQHFLYKGGCVPLMGCTEPVVRVRGKDGAVAAGWYPFGKGRVFVSSTIEAFSDKAASYVLDRPTPSQFGVVNALYTVFREADK